MLDWRRLEPRWLETASGWFVVGSTAASFDSSTAAGSPTVRRADTISRYMLRIVERLFGDGVLVAADASRTRAGYQLALYRDWTDRQGELVAGGFVVEGLVIAAPDVLAALLFTPAPLTLELEDGRRVAVYIVSEVGAVGGADDRGIEEASA